MEYWEVRANYLPISVNVRMDIGGNNIEQELRCLKVNYTQSIRNLPHQVFSYI